MSHESMVCSHCGEKMVPGSLSTPVGTVHIESRQSAESSLLEAWICLSCGHVELQALGLEYLARHDISDEELTSSTRKKGSSRKRTPGTPG